MVGVEEQRPPGGGGSSSSSVAHVMLLQPLFLLAWAWMSTAMMVSVLAVCSWHRRQMQRRREAADLAAAIQLSINDHIVSVPPAVLPAPSMRFDSLHSSRTARVSSAGVEFPNIKSIEDLKDHLSIGSIFRMKREWLARELSKGRDGGKAEPSPPRSERRLLQIVVRRDHVFQDSYLQFATISDDDLRNPLSVHFVGEVGRDDGGVTRDWYSVLSKEIFNPQYALFTLSAADDYTFQINQNSGVNPDHLDFFQFIGTIVGKALLDGCLLDAHFTRLVYKRILDKPVTYHDMASVDVQFYKSLCWLLENKLEGIDLSLTFSVDKENFGAYEEIELKEKGKDMVVTEQNKREYVDLLASWRLKESVEPQFQALRTGLARVVDPVLLQHFDENELEWLIGGLPTIDTDDWRKNTVYKAGYSDTSDCHVIRWFWLLVESWDQEMRARLLQFVTGTSKVPFPEGFKGLRGSEGLRSFHIVRVSDSTRLPQAHTCFNELILPDYDTYEELHNNLTTAIFETGNQFQLR
ncbi:hypothetical protein CY35_09G097100 [Sphagnum magellanicum]|nr:hypothetical protein CY35_09G097100 [Sphagnum magellanicum]